MVIMKINPDDKSRHIFGWMLGGPIFLLDIFIRKLSWKLWEKAYSGNSSQWEFYIGLWDMLRWFRECLDHYVDTVILPKLNCWFILL